MKKQFRGSAVLHAENSSDIMKLDYYLLEEEKSFEEEGYFKTYGIEIVKNDEEREMAQDVTVNAEDAISLVDKLKEYEVTPMHLFDVLENFL